MSKSSSTTSLIRWSGLGKALKDARLWAIGAGMLAFCVFLSTLQGGVNGAESPYTTDVGEIQNALPRWGTIHFTGYPLYTFLGSLFVSITHFLGIEPAAGCSLFSALWGSITIGLLVMLLMDYRIPPPAAVMGGLLFGVSKSFWVDASLAEVHTMSMAFMVGTLLFALRFSRTGNRGDFLWLVFFFSQGVVHQRANGFLLPAIAVLAWPHWRDIWRWRLLTGLLILGALLTYLYLPLRAWMGATWTFGQVGTWHGFWDMILDTKTGRIFAWPEGPSALLERFRLLITLWSEELPLPFMMIGLVSLLGKWASFRRERVAFTLGVIPYLVLGMLIWEGRISDALLAIQLPLIMFSIIGLSLGAATLGRYSRIGRFFASGVMLVTVGVVFLIHRPEVLAISRDPSAQEIVAQVRRIPFEEGEQVAALMAPWGREYWILAYEDTFHRAFPQVDLVDHNANFREITDQGQRLLVLEKAFYVFPPAWWEERLGGPIALDYVAPQVIQITPKTRIRQQDLSSALLDLGNGVAIISTEIARSPDVLELLVSWQAVQPIREDYSVGVHLLAHVPPGPQDILAQADRAHPIGGWYPTSQWDEREIVQDEYLLSIPEGSHPVAVRIGMYRILGAGQFANTPWLTIPLEQE